MKRITQLIVVALVVIALLLLGTTYSEAKHWRRLSSRHIDFGVSQFLATTMNTTVTTVLVRLLNPNHITQAAAVFVYDRTRGVDDTENIPERLKSCVVRKLTPHAAVGINQNEFPDLPSLPPFQEFTPAYGEIISAPLEPVKVYSYRYYRRTRLADGLGILAYMGSDNGERPFLLVNPKLFTLPENKDFAPTQREIAIQCVCDALEAQELSLQTFHEFGISCSDEP